MIELRCKNCGEKTGVKSLIAAASQACVNCGHGLMGGAVPRTPGAIDFGSATTPAWQESGASSSTRIIVGAIVGAIAGVGLVVGLGYLGQDVPVRTRGAILGALMGVLLSPVLVISSFLSMMFLPFSFEGVLGDSLWSRIARGLREGCIGPLVLPILFFVGLPMGLCALGGAKMTVIGPPALVTASLGAILLGTIVGGVCASILGKPSQVNEPLL
jgi:hypothetical protein